MVEPNAAWINTEASSPWELVHSPARQARKREGYPRRDAAVDPPVVAASMSKRAAALTEGTPRRLGPAAKSLEASSRATPYTLRTRIQAPSGPEPGTLHGAGDTPKSVQAPTITGKVSGQKKSPTQSPAERKPINKARAELSPHLHEVHAVYTGVLASSLRLKEIADKQLRPPVGTPAGSIETAASILPVTADGSSQRLSRCTGDARRRSQIAMLASALLEPPKPPPNRIPLNAVTCAQQPDSSPAGAGLLDNQGQDGADLRGEQQQFQGGASAEISMADLDLCLATGAAQILVQPPMRGSGTGTAAAAAGVSPLGSSGRAGVRCSSPAELSKAIRSACNAKNAAASGALSPAGAAGVGTAGSPAAAGDPAVTPTHGSLAAARSAGTLGSGHLRMQLPDPRPVTELRSVLAAVPLQSGVCHGGVADAAASVTTAVAAASGSAGAAAAAEPEARPPRRARSLSRLNPTHPCNGQAALGSAAVVPVPASGSAAGSGAPTSATADTEMAETEGPTTEGARAASAAPSARPVAPALACPNSEHSMTIAELAAQSATAAATSTRTLDPVVIDSNRRGGDAATMDVDTDEVEGAAAAAERCAAASTAAAVAAAAEEDAATGAAPEGAAAVVAVQLSAGDEDTGAASPPGEEQQQPLPLLAGLATGPASRGGDAAESAAPEDSRLRGGGRAGRDGWRGRGRGRPRGRPRGRGSRGPSESGPLEAAAAAPEMPVPEVRSGPSGGGADIAASTAGATAFKTPADAPSRQNGGESGEESSPDVPIGKLAASVAAAAVAAAARPAQAAAPVAAPPPPQPSAAPDADKAEGAADAKTPAAGAMRAACFAAPFEEGEASAELESLSSPDSGDLPIGLLAASAAGIVTAGKPTAGQMKAAGSLPVLAQQQPQAAAPEGEAEGRHISAETQQQPAPQGIDAAAGLSRQEDEEARQVLAKKRKRQSPPPDAEPPTAQEQQGVQATAATAPGVTAAITGPSATDVVEAVAPEPEVVTFSQKEVANSSAPAALALPAGPGQAGQSAVSEEQVPAAGPSAAPGAGTSLSSAGPAGSRVALGSLWKRQRTAPVASAAPRTAAARLRALGGSSSGAGPAAGSQQDQQPSQRSVDVPAGSQQQQQQQQQQLIEHLDKFAGREPSPAPPPPPSQEQEQSRPREQQRQGSEMQAPSVIICRDVRARRDVTAQQQQDARQEQAQDVQTSSVEPRDQAGAAVPLQSQEQQQQTPEQERPPQEKQQVDLPQEQQQAACNVEDKQDGAFMSNAGEAHRTQRQPQQATGGSDDGTAATADTDIMEAGAGPVSSGSEPPDGACASAAAGAGPARVQFRSIWKRPRLAAAPPSAAAGPSGRRASLATRAGAAAGPSGAAGVAAQGDASGKCVDSQDSGAGSQKAVDAAAVESMEVEGGAEGSAAGAATEVAADRQRSGVPVSDDSANQVAGGSQDVTATASAVGPSSVVPAAGEPDGPQPMEEEGRQARGEATLPTVGTPRHRTSPQPSRRPGALGGVPRPPSPGPGGSVGAAAAAAVAGGSMGKPPRSPCDSRMASMSPSPRLRPPCPSPSPLSRGGAAPNSGGGSHRLRDPSLHPAAVPAGAAVSPVALGAMPSVSSSPLRALVQPQRLLSQLHAVAGAAPLLPPPSPGVAFHHDGILKGGSVGFPAAVSQSPKPPTATLLAAAAAPSGVPAASISSPLAASRAASTCTGLSFLQPLAPIRTKAASPAGVVASAAAAAGAPAAAPAGAHMPTNTLGRLVAAVGVKPSIVRAVEALLSIPLMGEEDDEDEEGASPQKATPQAGDATQAVVAPSGGLATTAGAAPGGASGVLAVLREFDATAEVQPMEVDGKEAERGVEMEVPSHRSPLEHLLEAAATTTHGSVGAVSAPAAASAVGTDRSSFNEGPVLVDGGNGAVDSAPSAQLPSSLTLLFGIAASSEGDRRGSDGGRDRTQQRPAVPAPPPAVGAAGAVVPGQGLAAVAAAMGGISRISGDPPSEEPKPFRSVLRGLQPFFSAAGAGSLASGSNIIGGGGSSNADGSSNNNSSLVCEERLDGPLGGLPGGKGVGSPLPPSPLPPRPRLPAGKPPTASPVASRLGVRSSPNKSTTAPQAHPGHHHGQVPASPPPSLRPLDGYCTPPRANSLSHRPHTTSPTRGNGNNHHQPSLHQGGAASGWSRGTAAYPGHQYDSMIEDVVQQMLNEASPEALPPLELEQRAPAAEPIPFAAIGARATEGNAAGSAAPPAMAASAETQRIGVHESKTAAAGAPLGGLVGAVGSHDDVMQDTVTVGPAAAVLAQPVQREAGDSPRATLSDGSSSRDLQAPPPRRRSIYLPTSSGSKRRRSTEAEEGTAGVTANALADAPAGAGADDTGAVAAAGAAPEFSPLQQLQQQTRQQAPLSGHRRRPRKAARVDGGSGATAAAAAAAAAVAAAAASNRMDLDELSNLGSDDSDSDDDMLDSYPASGGVGGGGATAGGAVRALPGDAVAARGGGGIRGGMAGRGLGGQYQPPQSSLFAGRSYPGGGNWMKPGLAWSRTTGPPPAQVRVSPQVRPGTRPSPGSGAGSRPALSSSPTGAAASRLGGGGGGTPTIAGGACAGDASPGDTLLDVPRVLSVQRGAVPARRSNTYLSAAMDAANARPTLEQEYREALINSRLAEAWAAGERWARCDLAGLPADVSKKGVSERTALLEMAASKLNCYRGAEGAAKIMARVEEEWEHLKRIRIQAAARATVRTPSGATPSPSPSIAAFGRGGGPPQHTPLPFAAHVQAAAAGAARRGVEQASADEAAAPNDGGDNAVEGVAAEGVAPAESEAGAAAAATAAVVVMDPGATAVQQSEALEAAGVDEVNGVTAGGASAAGGGEDGAAGAPKGAAAEHRRLAELVSAHAHAHCHRGSPPPPPVAPPPRHGPQGPHHAQQQHHQHHHQHNPPHNQSHQQQHIATRLRQGSQDSQSQYPSASAVQVDPPAAEHAEKAAPAATEVAGAAAFAGRQTGSAAVSADSTGTPLPQRATDAQAQRNQHQGSLEPSSQATPPPAGNSLCSFSFSHPGGPAGSQHEQQQPHQLTPPPSILKSVLKGIRGFGGADGSPGVIATTGGKKAVKFAAVLELGPQAGYRHGAEGAAGVFAAAVRLPPPPSFDLNLSLQQPVQQQQQSQEEGQAVVAPVAV